MKGLPVRVVRSFKEKRSSYAPTVDTPVRYDGIYRILSCWRKPGNQGPLVCRYLFVRCDNAPAPWSSAGVARDACPGEGGCKMQRWGAYGDCRPWPNVGVTRDALTG
eukprot:312280-Chlamydomonas_euryale.AAC.1